MVNKSVYYSNCHLFSFGCKVLGIIGARGIGKTYSCKKYILKRFFNNGNVFAWLRDSENALDEVMGNDGLKFFKDIKKDNELKKYLDKAKIVVKDGVCKINGKVCGYFMSCSTFYKLKGTDYSDVSTIVYDEFIGEKTQAVRGDRAYEFLNMVETIGRLRNDYKIILTANALDKGSSILDALGIVIKGFGYYVNRSKDVAIHYADNNPMYLQKKLASISGKLMNNTAFGDNLLYNDFSSNKVELYDKKPKGCKCLCIFRNQYNQRIKIDFKGGMFYISNDENELSNKAYRFVMSLDLVNVEYKLANKDLVEGIQNAIGQGMVKYQSDRVYNITMELFSKSKKK